MDLPQAVLFDFSGTLMRVEPADEWVRAVAAKAELGLDNSQIAYWAGKLERSGGHSGGASPQRVPAYLQELWDTRDLDEDRHRAAYSGLIRLAGWPWEGLVDALYDRANAAEAWRPYPDAVEALETLRALGIKTGLISNISWDARLPLAAAGLLPLLDTVVLSYEAGFAKPDPQIFALACKQLDVKPADSVMVGDHEFDAGGEELGIRTLFVRHLPVGQRPHALADVVRQLTA
jgi:HAD superfamily hydrolase (TIGR01493 family)